MVPAGRRAAGTMIAALHGELTPHAWHDPEHDAYQLFFQRSLAMGWLDDTSAGSDAHGDVRRAPGLWGMNDAGWEHPFTAETNLVSWFQVEVSPVAHDRPLPVQPLLRCAEDATTRAGTVDIHAVQLLLPVQGLNPKSRPPWAREPAMRTTDWFAETAPHARTRVTVDINQGQHRFSPAAAQHLVDRLGTLNQDVFTPGAHGASVPDLIPQPPFDDRLWNGPPGNGVSLSGQLAEWSCDAIGWLAELIGDIAAQIHTASPLLLTVTRELPSR